MTDVSRVLTSVAAAVALTLTAAACSSRDVHNTEPTIDALAASVLSAVRTRDLERLDALALNEVEFREVVWPELPAARPERNLPFEFVWNDLRMKSAASLGGILEEYGETPMTLVRVRFDGETSRYGTYVVRRETVLVVTGPDGRERDVRLFGSVFEQDGRFKVFSYNVS
jgi:hypothetical protein